jgi:hypothetical protein
MTQTFITRAFFDPIFNGAGPVETANYSYRLLHNCDLRGLVLNALETLRLAGKLQPIATLEHRDFAEGHAFNLLIKEGLADLSDNERYLAAALIHNPLLEMIQTFMSKYLAMNGYLFDEVGFHKNLHRLVRRVNDFLNHPKLHMQKWKWPRGTGYRDDAFLQATRIPVIYMVRFNGWEEPTLFERVNCADWAEAQPLEHPFR